MVKDFIDDYEDDFYPKKETEIQIPEFITGENAIPTEEELQMQAMVNNVPNNTEIEKINHLAELERACQNWDSEEWAKVIIHANSHMMFAELDRRTEELEKSVSDIRGNLDRLASQKL